MLLLLNPRAGAGRGADPIIALDVSQSWQRAADATAWERARQRALALAGDSVLLVGHSVRFGAPPAMPADTLALIALAAERAQLAGRPLILHTDGESQEDPAQLRQRFPAGSQIVVNSVARLPDLAVTGLESPATAVAGDSLRVRVIVTAGDQSPGAGTLLLTIDGRAIARQPLRPLAPFERRHEVITARLPAGPVRAHLVVVIDAPGDSEPRNDSASRTIGRGEQMRALALSTSPDFDFREATRVLRGSLSLPTAVRSRVSQARWVDDGGRVVPEPQVRSELAAAQVVLLHGDTAFFGSPRSIVKGALVLVPFPADDGEWYLSSALSSPLSATLGTIAFDSLAPVAADPAVAGIPLLAARSGAQRTQNAISLSDSARRVVVAPIRGTARWALRGGVHSDAFATLWGSIFTAVAERPGSSVPPAPAVLPATELQPRRRTLESGVLGTATATGGRRPVRDYAWAYALVVVFLCTEWILRRRAGLR